ncbi:MAG: hypothetical protein ACLRSW_16800 [Christensenellaceae bacterium]
MVRFLETSTLAFVFSESAALVQHGDLGSLLVRPVSLSPKAIASSTVLPAKFHLISFSGLSFVLFLYARLSFCASLRSFL